MYFFGILKEFLAKVVFLVYRTNRTLICVKKVAILTDSEFLLKIANCKRDYELLFEYTTTTIFIQRCESNNLPELSKIESCY